MDEKAARPITREQQNHRAVMHAVAASVQDTPMVLKGGTALYLTRGLDRFSEDLDFDSTKSINLVTRIHRAARKVNVKITDLRLKKHTETTQRYMVQYQDADGIQRRLKIETKIGTVDAGRVETVGGIKTYSPSAIIDQKLEAAQSRAKIRDLYDLHFLSRRYPDQFTVDQAKRFQDWARDPDALASRYGQDLKDDKLLQGQVDLDTLALSAADQAETLMGRKLAAVRGLDSDSLAERHPDMAREAKAIKLAEKFSARMEEGNRARFMNSVRERIATALQAGHRVPEIHSANTKAARGRDEEQAR